MNIKKDYSKSKSDISEIHKQVGLFISGINKLNNTSGVQSINSTTAANASLKQQLSDMSQSNRYSAISEQDRLGLGTSGMGGYDASASQGLSDASQQGSDLLSNIADSNKSTKETGLELLNMNKGAKDQANEDAYQRMIKAYKAKAAADAYAKSNSFTPYSRGGGYRSNFVPYSRTRYNTSGPAPKKNVKVPLNYKTLPNLLSGLGASFSGPNGSRAKEKKRQQAIQRAYNNMSSRHMGGY